jgi:restriction system protein
MPPARYRWDPVREAQKAARQLQRAQIIAERESKKRHLLTLEYEAELLNKKLNEHVEDIRNILYSSLSAKIRITFDHLIIGDKFDSFKIPSSLAKELAKPEIQEPYEAAYLSYVKPPNWLARIIPGGTNQYNKQVQEAKQRYQYDLAQYRKILGEYQTAENIRQAKIDNLRKEYERTREAFLFRVQESNTEFEELTTAYHELEKDYVSKELEAIPAFISMFLERSTYPEGFPQKFRIAYLGDSKELIIEYELPSSVVIPSIAEYKFVKTRSSIAEKARKPSEIKELYQDLVASIALRTIHEIFEADISQHIEIVVFNGFVQTVDPATGKDIQPHLISVRVTRGQFGELDLRRIDKRACLRNLGAQASPRPAEMQAVKPIVDFDMVDKRFVEQSDVLTDLESRPNLMDLNPYEFENLVGNLFQKMGLDTKLTRSSRDGGVDAVAYDKRPILGGKVVIQAKRYRHTVGVSAVRDLYGTMQHEGANKGILVTTSSYGPDAYEFIKDKPVELIDGGGLLYLLDQHAGIKARIVFPEEN